MLITHGHIWKAFDARRRDERDSLGYIVSNEKEKEGELWVGAPSQARDALLLAKIPYSLGPDSAHLKWTN